METSIHFGRYGYRTQSFDSNSMLSKIRPNMRAVYSSKKKRPILFGLLIPVCIVMFMGGGVLTVVTPLGFLVLLTGFIGFGACGIMIGLSGIIAANYKSIVILMDEIEAHDKVSIDNLTILRYTGKSSVIALIKKLIDTENLKDYEIIGEVGVAKRNVMASPSSFGSASESSESKLYVNQQYTAYKLNTDANDNYDTPKKRREHLCPGCGAAITKHTGKYCKFCGIRVY